jgi:C_GCAxxG_C_C family probable redox protein
MAYEQSKEALLKEVTRRAEEKIAISGHCAQASFAALQEQFALDGGATLRALTPFPGIALRGETCGALTGCLMALGLVYGRDELDDAGGFFAALPPAREFCRRFEAEVGGTMCADILESELGGKIDLSLQSGFQDYLGCGGPEKCSKIILSGVRIAAEIIADKDETDQDPGVFITV